MKENTMKILDELMIAHPDLSVCKADIIKGFELMYSCYANGGKLLLAGNGGSASDCEHISGELMKSFMFKHKIDCCLQKELIGRYGEDGKKLGETLESGLPAIPLTSFQSVNTAFANDCDPRMIFAQTVSILGTRNDIFFGITTSGQSKNIIYAFMVAKSKGLKTICLTGNGCEDCGLLYDVIIKAPDSKTYRVQEYHLPIYHALCSMLESEFYA